MAPVLPDGGHDAGDRAEQLVDLREDYRLRLAGRRARFPEVVDLVFENPIVTSQRVARALDVTDAGAKNLIRGLADVDITRRRGSDQSPKEALDRQ